MDLFPKNDPKPMDELRLRLVEQLDCVGVGGGEDDRSKPMSRSNGENISLVERSGVTCLQKVATFNMRSEPNVNG